MHSRKALPPFALVLLACARLSAQTLEDGLMMPGRHLCTGFLYTHDSWDRYWEGPLEREQRQHRRDHHRRASPGSATTAITDRLNVIAMLPYVWTSASQGVAPAA